MREPYRPLLAATALLWLAGPNAVAGIYTCVDAQGRRLSSDRPIMECMDREQRELSPNGSLRRIVKPPPTALEQAAQEEAARREALARQAARDARRRLQALRTRYPDAAVLEQERAAALGTIDQMIEAAKGRKDKLAKDRRRLDQDLAPYKGDTSRIPAPLQQAVIQNDRQRQAQDRFIGEQWAERQRVNSRFDAMERELRTLWAPPQAAATARRPPAFSRPACGAAAR